jgi:hypothetical protein
MENDEYLINRISPTFASIDQLRKENDKVVICYYYLLSHRSVWIVAIASDIPSNSLASFIVEMKMRH